MLSFIALLLLTNPACTMPPDGELVKINSIPVAHQTKQILLVISDTIYRSGSRQNQALAVNGNFPPKFIMVATGNATTLTFSNNSINELTVDVPALMNATGKAIRQKIHPQQSFSISLNVKKTGISSYRIYRFEQKGPPTIGSVVVEYPKTR